MYLDFTYFAKQDSDRLVISSFISMFGYRGKASIYIYVDAMLEVGWMEKLARAI